MKRTILFIVLAAIASMTTAQTYTYRQDLKQEIKHLVVKGNCIVRLQHDTCNWIAYRGAERHDTARLVVIEGSKLTTTPAANDKTLYIGTTAEKDCNLDFEVKADAVVLYDGKAYIGGEDVSTRTIDTDDIIASGPRNWTGLTKYTASDRIHNQFYLGFNEWFPKKTKGSIIRSPFLSHTAWHMSYSLYMDDRIAAGIGLQWSQNRYKYDQRCYSYFLDEHSLFSHFIHIPVDLSAIPLKSEKSEIYSSSIDFPIHFTFYPNKDHHSFNLQLELIPQLNYICAIYYNLSYTQDNESLHVNYSRDMPFYLLQLKTRFSINFGIIGAYAETSLTPLYKVTDFRDKEFRIPYHLAFGVRLNLF